MEEEGKNERGEFKFTSKERTGKGGGQHQRRGEKKDKSFQKKIYEGGIRVPTYLLIGIGF